MQDLLAHGATVFFGLFAIMNPVANTPVFISLTAQDDRATTLKVARNALLLTFVLVATFCILGRVIFDLFGITLPAFRIVGGALVVLIGYHMLQGGPSDVQHPAESEQIVDRDTQLSVAITPLAMPILAGPGTIATAMSFVADGSVNEILITLVAFMALCLITYTCFVAGAKIVAYLGKAGLNIITRLMGLILAVIGMQMLIDGLKGAFPAALT